jgi:uncharacterized protein (TIGR01777 family)
VSAKVRRVVVSGSHGDVSRLLCDRLRGSGHHVTTLTRRANWPEQADLWFDPEQQTIQDDGRGLEDHDAVVHFGQATIRRPYDDAAKRDAVRWVVQRTSLVARTLASLANPPRVLFSESTVAWYGDRGDEVLTERSAAGGGFLAEYAAAWEEATAPASSAGIAVVPLRVGAVLSARSGLLARELRRFRWGLGGRTGSGRQLIPWISTADAAGAIAHLVETSEALDGPANICGPRPATNVELARALGHALRRPSLVPLPAAALRMAIGRVAADEAVLASRRVVPAVLEAAGYRFEHPELAAAIAALLA